MHGLLTDCDRTATHPAAPILAALQSYCGQIVDLDKGHAAGGAELRSAADGVAAWLAELGLSDGDRIVFSVGNGPAFTAALCGALAAGASPILLHGETPPQEMLRYARQYSARCILSQRTNDECRMTNVAGRELGHSSFSLDWLELHCTELALDPQGPTFPVVTGATLHPTSGTTGRAKIAVRTAEQTFEEARHYVETMQITRHDRILCVVPMSHAYGFGVGFMVSLLSGASLFTLRQFNPRTIPRALAEHEITIFPAVPAMLDLLLRAGIDDTTMPRLVLAAGAPLAEATGIAFHQQTHRHITPLYGTTETGGITVAVGEEGVLATGCVGRPMEGVEARVAPIAEATELAPGVGRVLIRSSSMMSGYLTPQGIDSSAIRDGWFETGDIGRLDERGRIQLVGREKEIISVFGMKVVPSEVEEVIATLAGVREVKVYPGTHRSGTEIVKAAVAAEASVDVACLRAHCEENLPPYKRPQIISLVEALPRSPMGKIQRDKLP